MGHEFFHNTGPPGQSKRRYYKLTAPGAKALSEATVYYCALLPAAKPRPAR